MAIAEKDENVTVSSKLNVFMEKNRKLIIGLFVGIIVAIAAFVVVEIVVSNAKTKNLAAIDQLTYELTDGSGSLEENELAARRDEVLEKLIPYTKKGGVAGVRANMLAADIEYQKKNYESALEYWENAADKDLKSYTASLALYNAGVCYEALNQLDDAAESYKLAADDEDFVLRSHALFCYGRVLETSGKYKEAVESYKELNEKFPGDGWANLAKTRIISLTIDGKAE